MMSTREINAITRYGGNGRNVYLTVVRDTYTTKFRVIRARSTKGVLFVKSLNDGQWHQVMSGDTFEIS